MELSQVDFTIRKLGPARFPSPMSSGHFVEEGARILFHSHPEEVLKSLGQSQQPPCMELAGPRRLLFFDPSTVRCGIVTCGGLCPGINDVIRAIVLCLHYHYGVSPVYGFRYGYEGLIPRYGHSVMQLTPEAVDRIHQLGGTMLGSSRGLQDVSQMVDTLERMGIQVLFTIGGDGTLRGAHALVEEISKRKLNIAVVGVPKTIDNDISFIDRSFGFETAVAEARRVTQSAHTEAVSARNGVGLVKLMGRESGFIAAYTVLADNDVNFCLVPEVPFGLERFLEALEARLLRRGHAVVVVAEGAGQDLLGSALERDASGNPKLGDIGVFLRDKIRAYFRSRSIRLDLKYIDPSYTIRSGPANAQDAAFCLLLGHHAVHAALSGRTDMVVGYWKGHFTHVPISMAVSARKRIDPQGHLWESVLAVTGQPREL
ncbi:MAG: ATP-dependent 6-phosphofructokinase [Thermodesulfobacteriota bacterium]